MRFVSQFDPHTLSKTLTIFGPTRPANAFVPQKPLRANYPLGAWYAERCSRRLALWPGALLDRTATPPPAAGHSEPQTASKTDPWKQQNVCAIVARIGAPYLYFYVYLLMFGAFITDA